MKAYDFIIAGAGIFGVTTALELSLRGYEIALLDRGKIPNPQAASTDISKAVRMEYGSDLEYMEMVIESMAGWKKWNKMFGRTLYHETGYLLLTSEEMNKDPDSYEFLSYQNLLRKGYKPSRLNTEHISSQFPAFNPLHFVDGFYHSVGGFVESALVVETLLKYAKKNGADIYESQGVEQLVISEGSCRGVVTNGNLTLHGGHVVICAGTHTPYLLPEISPFIRVTGHPVFHIRVDNPNHFSPPSFAVFGADISRSGWYGFPFHHSANVVKVANHGEGIQLHPDKDERKVSKADVLSLKRFLSTAMPSIKEAEICYTRRCLYTDTLDGHFWIDGHPYIKNLTVGTGGSGHAMKMAPVLGKMIADVAERTGHKWSDRYKWRILDANTAQAEEARFLSSHSPNSLNIL